MFTSRQLNSTHSHSRQFNDTTRDYQRIQYIQLYIVTNALQSHILYIRMHI